LGRAQQEQSLLHLARARWSAGAEITHRLVGSPVWHCWDKKIPVTGAMTASPWAFLTVCGLSSMAALEESSWQLRTLKGHKERDRETKRNRERGRLRERGKLYNLF